MKNVPQIIDDLYYEIYNGIKRLTPDPDNDFVSAIATHPVFLAVQVRALRKDLIQARIHNPKTEVVKFITGDKKYLLEELRKYLDAVATYDIEQNNTY